MDEIDPMEVSDEEFYRHKKEMHKHYEQWFLDLCQGIWDEYFAGMFAMIKMIKAETIYADEDFTCPHCGESWALFPRKDGRCVCHRCLTIFVMKRGADDGSDGDK
jgi:hypothetical protein